MPILLASWSAAPSATFAGGTGSVQVSCTLPAAGVSPYGRTIVIGGFPPRWLRCEAVHGRASKPGDPRPVRHCSHFQPRLAGLRGSSLALLAPQPSWASSSSLAGL